MQNILGKQNSNSTCAETLWLKIGGMAGGGGGGVTVSKRSKAHEQLPDHEGSYL